MHTVASLVALVDDEVPESQSLEFKQTQELQTRKQRAELLKDLTGMGNGGGGTVLYGVIEDDEGKNIAVGLNPLDDPGIQGRIENIVRAGVRPPLLCHFRQVKVSEGYVLEVVVDPSPLGPYMVTIYPNSEYRYFKRHGLSVDPMSEQEVRDGYSLALRAADRRPVVWANHNLPLRFSDSKPRVTVAAVPLEPLPELLDLRMIDRQDLQPPADLAKFINQACDAAAAANAAVLWAGGFAGTHSDALVRVHRDGSAGISQALPEVLAASGVARIADSMLAYLGWLWEKFDLHRPIELKLAVSGLFELSLTFDDPQRLLSAVQPAGVDVPSVQLEMEQQPWDIARPWTRHQVVRDLTDRLVQAYGQDRVEVPFTMGHLYDVNGEPLACTLQPALQSVYSLQRRCGLGTVESYGAIKSTSSGRQVAYVEGGVIVDLAGDTLAVVELGIGAGYPSGYYPPQRAESELPEPTGWTPSLEADETFERPEPTGRWSNATLLATLEDTASLTGS
jgi:hypothetical protein